MIYTITVLKQAFFTLKWRWFITLQLVRKIENSFSWRFTNAVRNRFVGRCYREPRNCEHHGQPSATVEGGNFLKNLASQKLSALWRRLFHTCYLNLYPPWLTKTSHHFCVFLKYRGLHRICAYKQRLYWTVLFRQPLLPSQASLWLLLFWVWELWHHEQEEG